MRLLFLCLVASVASVYVPSSGQIWFNNATPFVDIEAPPYPAFAFLPTSPPFQSQAELDGPALANTTDGFVILEDGRYQVDIQVGITNEWPCYPQCSAACTTVCENSCTSVCSSTCGEECATECSTTCVPVCNTTCPVTCSLNCSGVMLELFATLDRQFDQFTTKLVGSFHTVGAGDVAQYEGMGQINVKKGQTLTIIINNGSGLTPITVKLIYWKIGVLKISDTPNVCSSS